jgi:DNA mismatch endonuclease (patch repair protein)
MPHHNFASTPAERSELMRQIRSRNTKPELLVRSITHRMGYRFRLHDKGLPGKPDLVFPGRKKVIFVNGCFWHRHQCPVGQKIPRSNEDYWIPKLKRNRERDEIILLNLKELGWTTLVLWECELKNIDIIKSKIKQFLDNSGQ